MARKKNARSASRQAAAKKVSPMQRMEKDFLSTPEKLLSLVNKDVSGQRQKEVKVKNAMAKLMGKIKQSENKMKQAAKNLKTAAQKKQLNMLKKTHAAHLKAHAILAKQLQEATKSLAAAAKKQEKMAALRKHLTQFEKDWKKGLFSAKPKKAMSKSKAKVKAKPANKPAEPVEPVQEQKESQPYEIQTDDVRIEETIETS